MSSGYESNLLHDWYITFHYGLGEDILRGSAFSEDQLPEGCLDFPVATVEAFNQEEEVGRALDIGCAVGRSSFELSKIAGEVIGIDYSQSFVDAANEMKSGEPYDYNLYWEAHLGEPRTANLPAQCDPARVSFEQGDAMNLRKDLGSFDLVHAANLLCRLTEPKKFLDRLPELVNSGGKLVIATPATWMPEYTPVENIPPGETLEFLHEQLSGSFTLERAKEVPFFIREHMRKFQLSTSLTSLWTRL